jgi:lysyl-tRNA synthetase class 2
VVLLCARVCVSEQKRLKKEAEKEAAKAQAKAAQPAKAASAAAADAEVDETDAHAYHESRVKTVAKLQAGGINPYPHKFHTTSSIPAFVAAYKTLAEKQVRC